MRYLREELHWHFDSPQEQLLINRPGKGWKQLNHHLALRGGAVAGASH